MEFTDRISHIQSELDDYYSTAGEWIPEVEYEIDDLDILVNIRVYSCMLRPTDLEYFNSLVGKKYNHITFEFPYNDDWGSCLLVVYKF